MGVHGWNDRQTLPRAFELRVKRAIEVTLIEEVLRWNCLCSQLCHCSSLVIAAPTAPRDCAEQSKSLQFPRIHWLPPSKAEMCARRLAGPPDECCGVSKAMRHVAASGCSLSSLYDWLHHTTSSARVRNMATLVIKLQRARVYRHTMRQSLASILVVKPPAIANTTA